MTSKGEPNVLIWVGAIASFIGIVTFITGKATLPEMVGSSGSKSGPRTINEPAQDVKTKRNVDLDWRHGVRFKYKGITFRTNDSVLKILEPLQRQADTETLMRFQGARWDIKRKRAKDTDFSIFIGKNNRISSVEVMTDEVQIEGLKGIKVGDAVSKVFVKLGRPIHNDQFVYHYYQVGRDEVKFVRYEYGEFNGKQIRSIESPLFDPNGVIEGIIIKLTII